MAELADAAARPLAAGNEQTDFSLRILKLENRLQRERKARLEAETIAEGGLRELYDKQQQLALLQVIATKANQSESVEEALNFAVVEICGHTGWLLGNAYRLATSGPRRLVPLGICHATNPEHLEIFMDASSRSEFEAGVGLPGRVLASGQPAWITDVTADPEFPRADMARKCGLHSAFAFPVMVGNEVVAAIEFFYRDKVEPNVSLLDVMSQIGTQLGRVIERERSEQKLVHDATHDSLTGLPNRLLFLDRLQGAITRHLRHPETHFAVLFIDLDRFKLVNDSLGHGAGDALLSEISRRLSAAISGSENSDANRSSGHTVARLGGDEFTVLLEDISRLDLALEIAEKLIELLRQPMNIDGQEFSTTASIGIASSNSHYQSADDIMRDADLAMYRAKSQGRGRISLFDQSLHQTAVERLKLENDLRRALRNSEFVLHYQSIVELSTREVVGFEALVRWQRDENTLVGPDAFIGVSEDTGLIVFIGAWVLREACTTLSRWQHEFPRSEPLTMSVNVSPRQFMQPDFVEQVRQAVHDTGIDPATLRLEVTEGITIQEPDRTIDILTELRTFGVKISIDDFGTGYSSLSYLHRLPSDVLKIDRSFITEMDSKVEGRQIIQTILDLARNLKMDVVAEGTECADHVDHLEAMGCRFAQGYYFARPMDAESATALLIVATPA